MKKLFAFLLLSAGLTAATQLQAQEIVKGNLDFLKGVTEVNFNFVYNDMNVGKEGKEANYIKKKKAEKDAKEPGKGAEWEKNWIEDRPRHYEPKFIQLFSKYTDMKNGPDVKGKYTIVVDTKFLEPGYYVGVASGAAVLDLEITIYDAADMNKPLCKIKMDQVKGGKGMFDNATRIGEAYAKAGKELGKFVAKKTKK